MKILVNLMIAGGLIISGCQGIPADNTPAEPTASPTSISPTQGEIDMSSTPTPVDSGLQNLIQKIKEDLAGRLSIPEENIAVNEMIAVEWSDSSLDCPQPDMSYLQVITPGYRIVLQANEQSYEYHTNQDTYFVYCENPVPPSLPKP